MKKSLYNITRISFFCAFMLSCSAQTSSPQSAPEAAPEQSQQGNISTVKSETIKPGNGEKRQAKSLINNQLKAFAYSWYAKFDNGTTTQALAPYLAEDGLEFIYPQATINSTDALFPQFEASWAATKSSVHDVEEIFVHPTAEPDLYEIITPHTYYTQRNDNSFGNIDIIAKMLVRLGLKTKLDPDGALPKIQNYRVQFESMKNGDVSEEIAALRKGAFSVNDAKAFVHNWFAHTDARNAEAMIAMTASGPLDINILGSEITEKQALKDYLLANSGAQSWATHKPHNISVTPTDQGFQVRFIVHFEGDIEGVGEIGLTNMTNWLLIEEEGALKLRNYRLVIL